MAPFRKRRLISLSQWTASIRDKLGSPRRGLTGGGEEKGIVYPRIVLKIVESNVSFAQLWAKSARRPAVLTIANGGGSGSEISDGGSLCDVPLHDEPAGVSDVQGLSCFPLLSSDSAASSVAV